MSSFSTLETHLRTSHNQPARGIELSALGKQAARNWSEGKYPTLTEAVVETVKSASLNVDQVQRVVEFTNHHAFQDQFNKMGSAQRYVDFCGGPADPSAVMQQLSMHVPTVIHEKVSSDYSVPPPQRKKVADDLTQMRRVQEGFAVKEAELPYHDPLKPLQDLKDKVAGRFDEVSAAYEACQSKYASVRAEVLRNIKQAALNGYSLGEIAEFYQALHRGDDYVKVAFQGSFNPLIDSGVFRNAEEAIHSLEKVSSRQSVPDHDHPMAITFLDFCETLDKLASLRTERDELYQGLIEIQEKIKEANDGGAVGRGLRAVKGVVSKGGEVGEAAGKYLFGDGGATWGRRAGKALTVAAPALAANRLYRDNLHFNPKFQEAKLHTLGAIPGTAEYDYKDQLAAGMGGG